MRTFLLIFAVTLISCSQEEIPSDKILSEEKFTEVIKDLTLHEAILSNNPLSFEGNNIDSIYNINVFKKHDIPKSLYDSTLSYYSSKPKKMREIMEKVLEEINIEKTEAFK
ncbi:MAG: DUF4296 domain-containing protein [Bacteroidia bacterium]